MSRECRIFRPGKDGKFHLVETISQEEILKTPDYKRLFNVQPGGNQKIKPRNRKNKAKVVDSKNVSRK